MLMNIVVIEDNDDLRSAIVGILRGEGHSVVGLDCAEALTEQHQLLTIDLMVVDLNLPGEDGMSLAQRIRRVQPEIGIVMVTARDRIADRTAGYESGADIYLTKPVSFEELRAAIQSLARRLKPAAMAQSGLALEARTLTLRGEFGSVGVSSQEASLLAAFARAPDGRLEVWQILEIFPRMEQSDGRGAIRVMIFRLTKKLTEVTGHPRSIRAIRKWGYQLLVPIRLS